jgi:hypothetical protein
MRPSFEPFAVTAPLHSVRTACARRVDRDHRHLAALQAGRQQSLPFQARPLKEPA